MSMGNQEWWTSPLEDDNGNLIMVTGRGDVDKFRNNPKFTIRVNVIIPYTGDANGMPTEESAKLLDTILENFQSLLEKDPVAILTGIYTGAGRRDMVFYTLSTHIFNKKLNMAMESLPQQPLEITAENDPQWEEYAEMRSLSELY